MLLLLASEFVDGFVVFISAKQKANVMPHWMFHSMEDLGNAHKLVESSDRGVDVSPSQYMKLTTSAGIRPQMDIELVQSFVDSDDAVDLEF